MAPVSAVGSTGSMAAEVAERAADRYGNALRARRSCSFPARCTRVGRILAHERELFSKVAGQFGHPRASAAPERPFFFLFPPRAGISSLLTAAAPPDAPAPRPRRARARPRHPARPGARCGAAPPLPPSPSLPPPSPRGPCPRTPARGCGVRVARCPRPQRAHATMTGCCCAKILAPTLIQEFQLHADMPSSPGRLFSLGRGQRRCRPLGHTPDAGHRQHRRRTTDRWLALAAAAVPCAARERVGGVGKPGMSDNVFHDRVKTAAGTRAPSGYEILIPSPRTNRRAEPSFVKNGLDVAPPPRALQGARPRAVRAHRTWHGRRCKQHPPRLGAAFGRGERRRASPWPPARATACREGAAAAARPRSGLRSRTASVRRNNNN